MRCTAQAGRSVPCQLARPGLEKSQAAQACSCSRSAVTWAAWDTAHGPGTENCASCSQARPSHVVLFRASQARSCSRAEAHGQPGEGHTVLAQEHLLPAGSYPSPLEEVSCLQAGEASPMNQAQWCLTPAHSFPPVPAASRQVSEQKTWCTPCSPLKQELSSLPALAASASHQVSIQMRSQGSRSTVITMH